MTLRTLTLGPDATAEALIDRLAEEYPDEDRDRLAEAVHDATASSWAPVDLTPIVEGERTSEPPAYAARTDGVRLLYRGKVHQLSGEPESSKGWFCLAEVAKRLEAREHVLYIDFEDDAETAVERLRALGGVNIASHFHYLCPDSPFDTDAQGELDALLDRVEPTLAVIDGVTEALALEGTDIRDNTGVAAWLNLLPKRLKRRGICVVLIDHVTKATEGRGRFAIGAQHKLAGIDVSYGFRMVEDWGRGLTGVTIIDQGKDRPGHVKRHALNKVAARMVGESSHGGDEVTVTLHAPTESDGKFRPTHYMEKISREVEETPGTNITQLRALGKAEYVDKARECLIAERYIEERPDGPSKRHYSINPYREITDEALGGRPEAPEGAIDVG